MEQKVQFTLRKYPFARNSREQNQHHSTNQGKWKQFSQVQVLSLIDARHLHIDGLHLAITSRITQLSQELYAQPRWCSVCKHVRTGEVRDIVELFVQRNAATCRGLSDQSDRTGQALSCR